MSRRRAHLTFASITGFLVAGVGVLIWVLTVLAPSWAPTNVTPASDTGAPAPVVDGLVPAADGLALPKKLGSLRFAVMGDVGRGDRAQYDTAAEMARWRDKFDFRFVLMLGDNMYGLGSPRDYEDRFERPYKTLLDAGVVFYAANGNHDPPSILTYGPYNMNGRRYYTFTKHEGALPIGQRTVRFFAIDTVRLDSTQLSWLRRELGAANDDWEICFYHHPLYTSGRYRAVAAYIRSQLEPILVQFGAHVGLAGHEHFYERLIPQRGILHFTSGAGGALRVGDIRPSTISAAGFDTDTHFILMEISGDDLYFQAISRTGQTIDSGHITRIKRPDPPPSIAPAIRR